MATQLEWYGPQALAWIKGEIGRRLSVACLLVANRAKQLVSGEGAAKGVPGRREGGKFLRAKLRYGATPSAPGEPPNVQTGRGRGSIAWEVDALRGRVGTNVDYMRMQELGTRRMAARPWLRRALAECQAAIAAILSAPMKGP